ncbi:hypothetical protein FACS1894181_19130 [Bacteroidia bacterium]|nr:hypothetical protein FACS1894181_19130 [Bacteroidia bacterium]
MPDYIPKALSAFILWANKFVNYLFIYGYQWGISLEEATAFKAQWEETLLLIEQARDPTQNSHLAIVKKDAAVKAFKEKARGFVNHELHNRAVTNADRVALGLKIRNTAPAPVGLPVTMPHIIIDITIPRHIRFRFRDMDSHSEAKPYGVNGAVTAWAILDAPPATQDDLHHTFLATRSPHTIEFKEDERGKTLYIALCWQNEKGQRGPWSDIEKAIIP